MPIQLFLIKIPWLRILLSGSSPKLTNTLTKKRIKLDKNAQLKEKNAFLQKFHNIRGKTKIEALVYIELK